ncbi:MAG: Mov34/MPN/PAD-1 family protein, partial [Bifidobacteriaceae bacterium]|nr:Mov34/MPN/PAD-1 family protein [Bifidobacteriaceae bacterium]
MSSLALMRPLFDPGCQVATWVNPRRDRRPYLGAAPWDAHDCQEPPPQALAASPPNWEAPWEAAPEDAPPARIRALDPARLSQGMSFAITRDAYETIARTIGRRPAETGGVLGGSRALGLITHVHLDRRAQVSAVTYSPDIAAVNGLLRDHWDPAGIDFMGMVHSHPGDYGHPSWGDEIYAER